jgi:chromosome segregation ATPase
VIESNVSIEWRQEDFDELRKRSSQIGKEVDKLAAELDMLMEKESELLEEIRRCDAEEMSLISDFDKWIVYYNEVAASRMKELQKRVKELRKKRVEGIEELGKIRTRICVLESKCEMMSYRQGEIMWESKMQGVKKRRWKA